jgi:hypothetical protein
VTEPQFGRPTPSQFGRLVAPQSGAAAESDGGLDDTEFGDQAEYDDEVAPPDEVATARLAAALARIDEVMGRPPAEQVAAFTEAQQTLQATLARIDTN